MRPRLPGLRERAPPHGHPARRVGLRRLGPDRLLCRKEHGPLDAGGPRSPDAVAVAVLVGRRVERGIGRGHAARGRSRQGADATLHADVRRGRCEGAGHRRRGRRPAAERQSRAAVRCDDGEAGRPHRQGDAASRVVAERGPGRVGAESLRSEVKGMDIRDSSRSTAASRSPTMASMRALSSRRSGPRNASLLTGMSARACFPSRIASTFLPRPAYAIPSEPRNRASSGALTRRRHQPEAD